MAQETDLKVLVSADLRTGPVVDYQGPFDPIKPGGYQIGDTVLASDNFIYLCVLPTGTDPTTDAISWRRLGGNGLFRQVVFDSSAVPGSPNVSYRTNGSIDVIGSVPPATEVTIVRNADTVDGQSYTLTLTKALLRVTFRSIGGGGGGGAGSGVGSGAGGGGGSGFAYDFGIPPAPSSPWYTAVNNGDQPVGKVYTIIVGFGGAAGGVNGRPSSVASVVPAVTLLTTRGGGGGGSGGTAAANGPGGFGIVGAPVGTTGGVGFAGGGAGGVAPTGGGGIGAGGAGSSGNGGAGYGGGGGGGSIGNPGGGGGGGTGGGGGGDPNGGAGAGGGVGGAGGGRTGTSTNGGGGGSVGGAGSNSSLTGAINQSGIAGNGGFLGTGGISAMPGLGGAFPLYINLNASTNPIAWPGSGGRGASLITGAAAAGGPGRVIVEYTTT